MQMIKNARERDGNREGRISFVQRGKEEKRCKKND